MSVSDVYGIGANRALSNLAATAINDALNFDPGSDIDVDLITIGVTGTPKLWWDEATDSFEMNKSLTLPGGSLKIGGRVLSENATEDDEGFDVIGALHVHEYPGGIAGNICLYPGTEPIASPGGNSHRMWVDAAHNLKWQDESGVSVGLANQGDITAHANDASAHHARYIDAEAIAAIESEATLYFQQATTISAQSGGLVLESLSDALILQAGSNIRCKSEVKVYDDKKFYLGTDGDYWFVYNSSGTKLRFLTTDGDGAGSDMDIFYVNNGTDDPVFPGIIKVDTIEEKTTDAGVTIDSVLLKDGLVDGINVAARDHDSFLQSDADLLYEALGDIAIHAAVVDAHHARYTDAEAIAAIENEATLAFQQSTTISTKSGAGALILESVGNTLILQAGTDIRLKDDVLLFDNKKLWLGTSKDYWFEYNTSGSRLRCWTNDGDGAGADMVWMRILDGTIDPQFLGAIEVDTINPYTGGGWLTLGKALVGDRLHVQGSESVGGTNATIEIENTAAGGDRWFLRAGATGTPTPAGGFSIADTTSYRLVIDEDGNVGIGTTVPVLPLEVRSADDNQIMVFDSRSQAQGVGGGIAFGGKYTDAGAEAMAGRIGALKTNSTSGNVAFDIVFESQDSVGTMTERMKLTSGGDLLPAGTVDGRDVATDGSKLDTMADGAGVPTKEFFTSAGAAILSSNASYPTPNNTYHLALADGVTFARCFFVFHLSSDFSSMASGYPKVRFAQGTGGTGNYRIAFNARAGGAGESMGDVLDSISEYSMAAPGVGSEQWDEDVSAAFDGLSLAAGDSVGLQIQRDSDDSLDTFVGDLDVVGVVVKYT